MQLMQMGPLHLNLYENHQITRSKPKACPVEVAESGWMPPQNSSISSKILVYICSKPAVGKLISLKTSSISYAPPATPTPLRHQTTMMDRCQLHLMICHLTECR